MTDINIIVELIINKSLQISIKNNIINQLICIISKCYNNVCCDIIDNAFSHEQNIKFLQELQDITNKITAIRYQKHILFKDIFSECYASMPTVCKNIIYHYTYDTPRYKAMPNWNLFINLLNNI